MTAIRTISMGLATYMDFLVSTEDVGSGVESATRRLPNSLCPAGNPW
jgi:hypothetical protein